MGRRNKVVSCKEPEISTLIGTLALYLDDICGVTDSGV